MITAGVLLAGAAAATAVLAFSIGPSSAESPAPPPVLPPAAPTPTTEPVGPRPAAVRWRKSRSSGPHTSGRLRGAVQLPSSGVHFTTWDPILRRSPNRHWRRWAHDRALKTTLRIIKAHRKANPGAPRLLIGDISRPRGGDFGIAFGRPGHASHQTGLDVDIYYPRKDRRELVPTRVRQIDLALSQDLVNRFVSAGATYVFVGPNTGLKGRRGVVVPLAHHDNHIHVRFPARPNGH